MTTPDVQPPAPKSALTRWVTIAAGVIAALIGVAKVAEAFILPGCNSSRSLGAVRSIFKDKNLPEPTLTDPSRSRALRRENLRGELRAARRKGRPQLSRVLGWLERQGDGHQG